MTGWTSAMSSSRSRYGSADRLFDIYKFNDACLEPCIFHHKTGKAVPRPRGMHQRVQDEDSRY